MSSRQKYQSKRNQDHLCLALIEWNFEEAVFGTGAKRSRRRVQMRTAREIRRGGRGDGVETVACSLTGNSGSDRQPVKMSEYWTTRQVAL